ncbi:MAG: PH domain-containing protein [Phycisphaerales bacterium]
MKYRVVGADPTTGAERVMEVEASSAGEAERLGIEAGMVVEQVSAVRAGSAASAGVGADRKVVETIPLVEEPEEERVPAAGGVVRGSDREERTVWEGGPSQWGNAPVFVFGALLAFLVVPLIYALVVLLETRFTRYELTTQRLRSRSGVLSKRVDEIELYRVRDFTVEQSVWQRAVGLGSVRLVTSDRSHPEFVMKNVRGHGKVADLLREHTETMRRMKRVRELDVE